MPLAYDILFQGEMSGFDEILSQLEQQQQKMSRKHSNIGLLTMKLPEESELFSH